MRITKHIVASVSTISVLLLASVPGFSQQQATQGGQASSQVEKVIKGWKAKPQLVAREMVQKYGVPQEITAQRLIWHNNGPWQRTELVNEEIDHQFPLPHKDMLKQVVSYQVPPDKFDDLAQFDGNVIVERTTGELAARCDKEAANILALNLAYEIATGKRSVEDARKTYGEQIVAFAASQPAPLTEKLTFQPQPKASDPDKITLDDATVNKTKKLMKEMDKKKAESLPK